MNIIIIIFIKISSPFLNQINKYLSNNNNLNVSVFNREKIYCNWEFNPLYKDTYLIYKSFVHHDKNMIKHFNNRIEIFKKFDLITNEEYNANYKYY